MEHDKVVREEDERHTFTFRLPRHLSMYDFRVTPCYRFCWECRVKFLMLTRTDRFCHKACETRWIKRMGGEP